MTTPKAVRPATAFSGPNLTKALKARGITKWRLAKDLGISYRIVQYWEKGKYAPSKANADRIADYLGMAREVATIDSILARLSALEALHPELGLPIHPPFKSSPQSLSLGNDLDGEVGSPRKAHAQDAGEGVRVNSREGA